VTIDSLEKAAALAAERPVLTIRVTATTTAAAQKLATLAQPFGAEAVTLMVNASGDLRTGGTMSFMADGVKLTHPARPLETATLVANSLAEGSYYEATVTLAFGSAGRHGLGAQLQQLAESTEDVKVQCEFGPPAGVAA
jgi:hypothetical protein